MKKLLVVAALAIGTCASSFSAKAAITILAGSGGPNPSENVLFSNNPPDGLTVQGITNHPSSASLVNFTGVETLHGNGGQASLEGLDGAFGQVSWILNTPNTGYTDLKFAIDFPNDPNTDGQDTGIITIDIVNRFGSHTIFSGELSSAGANSFQAHATAGDLIAKVTLTGPTQWTSLQSVRLGEIETISAAVPELSTWAMMLIGFAGLGLMAYRRAKKRPASA